MNKDDLREVLLEHDPAAGRELPPDAAATMKHAVLTTGRTYEPRVAWRPFVAAFVGMVVFVIAAILVSRPAPEGNATPSTLTSATEAVQPASNDKERTAVRQIQYTTEGGTRVIWNLDPDFEL